MSHSSAAKMWALAVAVALVALVVVWLRPGHRPQALPEVTTEQAAPPPPTEPHAPSAPPPATPTPAPPTTSAEADPYGMPKPSSDQIRPRPDQRTATPEEQKETQKAAQELVESGIARLENERRQAEQTGDTETAQRNQIRIERLRKRLETLKQEAAPSP